MNKFIKYPTLVSILCTLLLVYKIWSNYNFQLAYTVFDYVWILLIALLLIFSIIKIVKK
ncbi:MULTISPECIES: hypothetical protein [Carnobacterium]|uniref:hypothetical protein n=1 Tax=Carnobacterium TaxID=2747 RepID=UPI0012FBE99A|nr:hypothetical protein [Carnobacterium maltaromaticum]